jgi:hypothetical protein
MKRTRSKKSRDTVPLRILKPIQIRIHPIKQDIYYYKLELAKILLKIKFCFIFVSFKQMI